MPLILMALQPIIHGMRKQESGRIGKFAAFVWCIASLIPAAHAETFVIPADQTGHEATVKIPVGAITQLSARSAESLVGYADPGFESMRLRGDVLIGIAGRSAPIEIRADEIVLELTPDTVAERPKGGRDYAAAVRRPSRSAASMPGIDGVEVFVGNVVFDLQTAAGPVEIKAERVEQQSGAEPGA
jgi:hypothetical protein